MIDAKSSKQSDDFVDFLASEWKGVRQHSYKVPQKTRWGKSLKPVGQWTVLGLKGALEAYNWNGKNYKENEIELSKYSKELRDAIARKNHGQALNVCHAVMKWGGVSNSYRQDRTFKWLQRSGASLCDKISEAVICLKKDSDQLNEFDGQNLIMNSAVTKITSLADPDESLVIYDSRVGSALCYFVAKFADETNADVLSAIRFAKGTEARRNPNTKRVTFPPLFGSHKDREHADMVRRASKVIGRVSKLAGVKPREIEAALFMWGYDVAAPETQKLGGSQSHSGHS